MLNYFHPHFRLSLHYTKSYFWKMNLIVVTIIYVVAYIHNKCECLHVSLYYRQRICKHKIAIWTPLVYCHTFPLSALSFSLLHVSTVSLLSKKGLRYLLYPFISLWMVGGRISPSFTSAFSMELSNSLRTKREWNSEKLKSKFFVCVVPLFKKWSSQPPVCSYNLQGAEWKSCKPRSMEEKEGD